MPVHFRGIEQLPFPYLKRAREVIRFLSFKFLNSHTSLKTVNGKDIIVLPIPATEGSSTRLLGELHQCRAQHRFLTEAAVRVNLKMPIIAFRRMIQKDCGEFAFLSVLSEAFL